MGTEIELTGVHVADPRCPHIVFRDILGERAVAGLLRHVAERKADFKAGVTRNRVSGGRSVNYEFRDCLFLMDLGMFAAPIREVMLKTAVPALSQFHLTEKAVEPREFEIIAYRDGSHFDVHIDTDERLGRVRVLSCVYYFAATPRRFSGGELRIYGMPTLSAAKGEPPPFVDVVPETDTMVVFPSWLRHEVRPVAVPSGEWLDSRFTVNCWLHRAA